MRIFWVYGDFSGTLYNISPHYPINGAIFEKKKQLLSIKCVFLQLLSALQYFSTLSDKRRDFKKNIIEHKMRVSTTFVRSTIFLHIIPNKARFSKKTVIEHKVRVSTTFVRSTIFLHIIP